MSQRKMARPGGKIDISVEVRAVVPRQFIAQAITHLRMGGGKCFLCGEVLKPWQSFSAVADVASTGTSLRFMHREHGPSQVREFRRDRRMSIVLGDQADEVKTDAYAFAVHWSLASPPAGLIVSPVALQGSEEDEDGQVRNPWFEAWGVLGLKPLAPPVVTAELLPLEDAAIAVEGEDKLMVRIGEYTVFDGTAPIPDYWRQAVASTGTCRLLVTQVAVVSDRAPGGSVPILDELAAHGAVRGAVATARLVTTNGAAS